MRLITSLLLMLFCGSMLFAQQTRETVIVPQQIEPLALGEVIYGNGTINVKGKLPAAQPVVTPTGALGSVDVQAALEELQSEIVAAAGGESTVQTGPTITGDGSSASPLSVVPAQITTSALNNDAGFISTPDDADADPANELQTIGKSGTTVTLSDGGGTFTDEVNDADADSNNEIQTLSESGKNITASLGGGTVSKIDPFRTEFFTPTNGSTISIPSAPDVSQISNIRVRRGAVPQTVATSGTSSDVTIAGTTLTFNYRAFDGSELVVVEYVEN